MQASHSPLSRRDFLKLGGLGFMGALLPNPHLNSFWAARESASYPQDVFDPQQGRVTTRLIWLYDKPSFNASRLKMYWLDTVLTITDVAISDDLADYNRVWYQIGAEGYAYSGTLQPVQTILDQPTLDIPASGRLGEVSVPYTDAHQAADLNSGVAYRMYYETVHWVMSAVTSPSDGRIWYQVLDDKWNKKYYAPGEHLRLLTDDELLPFSSDVPGAQKTIQVRLDDQLVYAYENGVPVFITRAASGKAFKYGTYTTPTGTFMTYYKRPTRHMANGDITADGYDLPGVPWVMYFTEAGLSLHGTFWHNDFGHPKSHGCVNLSTSAAKWLFRWTEPVVKPGEQYAYQAKGTILEIVK
jgi:lipoprotein-anchoring transpeptidase ErfK/SrfK